MVFGFVFVFADLCGYKTNSLFYNSFILNTSLNFVRLINV